MNNLAVPAERWRSTYAVFVAVALAITFFSTFRGGLDRGYDRVIPIEAWGRYHFAIGSVLTERLGLPGYVVADFVESALERQGFTDNTEILAALGLKYPQNFYNLAWLERFYASLPRLPLQRPGDVYTDLASYPGVRGVQGDDLGNVDFVRLSFALFGYQPHAFYFTFMLLLSLSAGVAWLSLRRTPWALTIILMAAIATWLVVLHSNLFSPYPDGQDSPINPRFMSVLGLIPALHIIVACLLRFRMTLSHLLPLVVQAGLLFFSYKIRSSSVWMIALVVVVASSVAAFEIWRARPKRARPLPGAWQKATWPAVVLLVVIVAGNIAVSARLNPVYSQYGHGGRHAFWHSVYYSLGFHPDWSIKYGPSHKMAKGDNMPFAGIDRFLAIEPKYRKEDYLQAGGSLAGGYRVDGYETLIRKAFFRFMQDDPRFVAETFLIYKPLLVLDVATKFLELERQELSSNEKKLLILAVALAAIAATAFIELSMLATATLFIFIGFGGALLINFLTVVGLGVMGEQMVAMNLFLLMFCCAFSALLLKGALPIVAWARKLRRAQT